MENYFVNYNQALALKESACIDELIKIVKDGR